MKFSEYKSFDMVGLSELLEKREVTATDLLDVAKDAYERVNPQINAITYPMFEEARRQAAKGRDESRFKGIPFLIKDLGMAYEGHPMSLSSQFSANYIPDYHSVLVERFMEAGLLICGKSNVPEFGILGVTEPRLRGPCRNPWNLEFTPGGSSGGSAAAVAAGIVPAAQADDGGGSIRIPASACGLVGLKPTRGRTPVGPKKTESWAGLVSALAVTKTVRDTAALLDEVHGPEVGASYFPPGESVSYSKCIQRPQQKLRVAFSVDSLLGKTVHPDCRQAVLDVAQSLEDAGHHIEEASPSLKRDEIRLAYFIIKATSVAHEVHTLSRLLGKVPKRQDFEDSTWFFYLLGSVLSASEFYKAIQTARECSVALDQFHAKYDLWLLPTLAHPPSPIGLVKFSWLDRLGLEVMGRFPVKKLMLAALDSLAEDALEKTPNTQVFNLSGTPAISVPTHFSTDGLPVGVQLAAAMGREDTLLNVAQQLEEIYGWNRRDFPSFE